MASSALPRSSCSISLRCRNVVESRSMPSLGEADRALALRTRIGVRGAIEIAPSWRRIGSRDLGETDGPSVFLVFKLDGSGRQLQNRCSLALRQERQ